MLVLQNVIAVDDLVLTNVAKYAGEWPQLGKVIAISKENLTVHWFKGSKTGTWTPCTKAVGRGKRENWTEDIKEADVWCHGFTLTNSNKLPTKIKEQIDNYVDFQFTSTKKEGILEYPYKPYFMVK